ncbi:hypothetical protein BU26DRAFT_348242 [Trematosphaeria pertusa]|uniref:Uncharacterized protein n=1 Tax=Trematosphaeria pertusa TaxID=390896 RepID=A0A6A6IA50_9PLEO|nr:uncharacterized protein BU26DRAFT_348242 [Trematosphaeria pertusa]KAF2247454.1 hypothetical protein BU26DRAFT_348242 [Trematosphaeria pertusa]
MVGLRPNSKAMRHVVYVNQVWADPNTGTLVPRQVIPWSPLQFNVVEKILVTSLWSAQNILFLMPHEDYIYVGSTTLKVQSRLNSASTLDYTTVKSNSKEEVHHVAQTHALTVTHHETETAHKAGTGMVNKVVTRTDHVKETDHVWMTKTGVEAHKTTQTVTKTETTAKEVEATRWTTTTKTNQKEVKVTKTVVQPGACATQGHQAPQKSPQLSDEQWTMLQLDGQINGICCFNPNKKRVDCYGTTGKDPVKYKEVKDKKFEKCVREGDAHCFDGKFRKGLQIGVFLDRHDKVRGSACAGAVENGREHIMCWGTPNRNPIKYKKLSQGELTACLYDGSKCRPL